MSTRSSVDDSLQVELKEEPRRGPATATLAWVRRQRALPAFIGAFLVWVATAALAGHGGFATLTSGISIGTFLLFVGIGQMFVITTGNGGIDLSVPYVMTLSAYLTSSIMAGKNSNLLLALLAAIVIGLVIGIINVILIELVGVRDPVGDTGYCRCAPGYAEPRPRVLRGWPSWANPCAGYSRHRGDDYLCSRADPHVVREVRAGRGAEPPRSPAGRSEISASQGNRLPH
jgi:hypothetical protein